MADPRLFSPWSRRNRDAILAVLQRVLPSSGLVLELNCGSGEHAVYFAENLPQLTWQPSDIDPAARASAAAHGEAAGLANLRQPLDLDATWNEWPVMAADAVLSINMIHIAPWTACLGLLDGAARLLPGETGVLYLYGPFQRGGVHTAPSNAQFDASLRAQNPDWGIRNLDTVIEEAGKRRLEYIEIVEMPANNLSAVFRKLPAA